MNSQTDNVRVLHYIRMDFIENSKYFGGFILFTIHRCKYKLFVDLICIGILIQKYSQLLVSAVKFELSNGLLKLQLSKEAHTFENRFFYG